METIGFVPEFGIIISRRNNITEAKSIGAKKIKEAFFMTTLFFDDYTSASEQNIPKWMREERYMYCEPVAHTKSSLWNKFLTFFL